MKRQHHACKECGEIDYIKRTPADPVELFYNQTDVERAAAEIPSEIPGQEPDLADFFEKLLKRIKHGKKIHIMITYA